jgi:NTE family protein
MIGKTKLFDKKKAKIGLALGSGAARGLAHIGVLKALMEE